MPEPVAPPQESAPSYEGLLAAAGLGTAAPPAAATAASLGAIATTAQVAQAVAALVVKMRAGSGDDHTGLDWIVNAVSPTFPDTPDKVVLDYVRGEAQREDAFWAAVETRLRRDMPGALQSKDPEAAIGALLERERRFIALHDEAAVGRVEGAVKLAHLQEVSPAGAYWRLDPTVVKHTPDCIAMAVVGWWPHAVLNKIAPPVHTGCRCHLLSHDEARAAGLMGKRIPDTSKALAKAEKIARDYGHLQESFWLNGDPSDRVLAWVEHVVAGARNSELDSAAQSRISRLIQANWDAGGASAAGTLELTEVAESPDVDSARRMGGMEHPKLDGKLDPLAIEEAYYDRRFGKGTLYGGRFMPKRGGTSPGIDINAVLHALLGSDAPHLRRRVGRDAETPHGAHVDRLPDSHGLQADAKQGELKPNSPKSGAASPAVGPSRDGTAGAEFRAVAAGVRERIDGIAKSHGAASNLGTIAINPERVDTEGWRSWSGDVEMGPEAQVALAQMGRTHARGEQLQGDEAASAYHAVRATMHEGIHSVNPISADLYAGSPSAYALEEALTEEMAHVHTVAYLREHGGQDVLRWLANASPNDIRAEGVYQPQRAGLAAILDEAQVPITARADLLDSLKFGTAPANREAVLAGLLSAKTGIPQSDALYSVRGLLESTASIDPIGKGGRVLVPDLPEAHEAKIPLGASVKVQDRYAGKVTEVGTLSDGHPYVEVEVKGPDGPAWRYADPAHVEVTHRPTKQLKGDKIQGTIREGDKAVVTLPGGKELPVKVERVEPDDVLGWRATGRTATGQVVTLRANSIDSIEKAKRKAATKAPPAPSTEGAKSEVHVGVSKILDKATGSPAPVKLKEIGGARAFDARHYQNPKRSLNAKLRALPKGETLHMADGTKVERGKHGSYLLTAPDGQRKRYAAPHRLSNAEIGTIESRHGLGAASPGVEPHPQIGVGLNGQPLHVGDDVSQPTNDSEIGVINAGNLWKIREDGWAVVSTEDGDVEVPADQLQVDRPANPEGGMASPPVPKGLKGLVGKLLDNAETPGTRYEVADSLHENPPEPVVGIPSYEGVELKDVKAAGGSNGARFAEDPEGRRWLVKTYKGNRDRVATELLANAVYRDLGVRVPNAGSAHVDVPGHGKTLALTYPLVDGETRHWGEPDAQLAKGYVADALLANWDVVGLEQDNVLWTPDDEPVRVDQGGTLAYRAMGAPKPFGPVPTELWTMNQPGGQAFGRMEITEPALRAEAKDIELRVTDARIDELVDAAGFEDENQREAVRAALKDRVAWLGEFGRGEQDLPKPNQGDDLRDSFADRDENLSTTPGEDAALRRLLEDPAAFTKQLTSGQKPEEAPEQIRDDITALDALLRDPVAALPEDAVIHVPIPAGSAAALGDLKGKFFSEPGYLIGDIDVPSGGEYVRVKLPRGAGAIAPEALESFEGPTTGAVIGARGLKLKVEGPGDDGIIDMITSR